MEQASLAPLAGAAVPTAGPQRGSSRGDLVASRSVLW